MKFHWCQAKNGKNPTASGQTQRQNAGGQAELAIIVQYLRNDTR